MGDKCVYKILGRFHAIGDEIQTSDKIVEN